MRTCRRCYISGRVQGVWYRDSTQKQARQLGITGYAKNLHDGRVEIIACGDEAVLEELLQWCRVGPQMAQVTNVICENVELDVTPGIFKTFNTFEIC